LLLVVNFLLQLDLAFFLHFHPAEFSVPIDFIDGLAGGVLLGLVLGRGGVLGLVSNAIVTI